VSDSPENRGVASDGPWLANKSGYGQVGTLSWFYISMGTGMAFLFLGLLAMDAIMVMLGLGIG
jgi:hypothetical protein